MSGDEPSAPGRIWPRLVLAALFAIGFVAFFALGGPRYLDLEAIKSHRDALLAFTGAHMAAAFAAMFAVYVLVVALSIPGAAVLSLTAGLLFGRWLGTLLTVTAATLGATIVFLAARYLFADLARRRLGPRYERIRAGFDADAFNYLLFLRLVPAFPFFLVNLAPALAGIPLRTYVVATALGIIPGSFVFVNLGGTLGRIASTRDLLTASTVVALVLLGVLALLPVAWRRMRRREASRG